jgi:hypothetical protein
MPQESYQIDHLSVDLLAPDYRHARVRCTMDVWYSTTRYVMIPSGFVTDFASVPRIFWRVFPPLGPWAPAAVAHDLLYARGEVARKEADRRFYGAMRLTGVPWLSATILYLGVRVGGWYAWRQHRRNDNRNSQGERNA